MPIAYYGSKISPHMTRSPEGYLICHDVPINRVGVQKYYGSELGMTGEDASRQFDVLRRPDEVFSPATLASFEGKPVTDEHPPDDVTPENIHVYQNGHVQNVRKGQDGRSIADLYITDPTLIREIENGKREISCGYKFTLFQHPNGALEQRNMIGNHVAVVANGRAGHEVRIKDSAGNGERSESMANETKKTGWLGRILKSVAATDASPEDIEELAKLHKTEDEEPEPEKDLEYPPKDTAEDEEPGDPVMKEVCGLLRELISYVKPKEAEDDDELSKLSSEVSAHKEPDGDEDADEEPNEDDESSVTVDPEDIHTHDAMNAAIIGVRDTLKKHIKDPKAFKLAAKDAADLRKQFGIGPADDKGYAGFVQKTRRAQREQIARAAAQVARQTNREQITEQVRNGYDAMNPHKHKEVK